MPRKREVKPENYYGQKIVRVKMVSHELHLTLDNGKTLVMEDAGQSCCEHRYMSCDDDLNDLVGGFLLGIAVEYGNDPSDDYDIHEEQFLKIQATTGSITVVNHNGHNGYYGGFYLTYQEI